MLIIESTTLTEGEVSKIMNTSIVSWVNKMLPHQIMRYKFLNYAVRIEIELILKGFCKL
jgi:hypothetical protein